MKRKGRFGIGTALAAILLIVAGNAVMLYPEWSDFAYQQSVNEQCAQVDAVADGAGADEAASASSSGDASASANTLASSQASAATKRLSAYNAKVRESREGAVGDPFLFPPVTGELDGVLLDNGLLGYIEIPAMKCKLPLYYGSTEENMAKGATVVAGTTVPLDQAESNCVIAAHRGYAQSKMFRDIEVLKKGDAVKVVAFWGTYWYRVSGTEIIDPSDVSAVMPQAGKDQVTLLTCHPYPSNAQRYLVFCDRVDASQVAGEADVQASGFPLDFASALSDTAQLEKLVKLAVLVLSVAAIAVLVVKLVRRPRGAHGPHGFDR